MIDKSNSTITIPLEKYEEMVKYIDTHKDVNLNINLTISSSKLIATEYQWQYYLEDFNNAANVNNLVNLKELIENSFVLPIECIKDDMKEKKQKRIEVFKDEYDRLTKLEKEVSEIKRNKSFICKLFNL
jgi:adenylate kinase family enzyme